MRYPCRKQKLVTARGSRSQNQHSFNNLAENYETNWLKLSGISDRKWAALFKVAYCPAISFQLRAVFRNEPKLRNEPNWDCKAPNGRLSADSKGTILRNEPNFVPLSFL